MSPEDLIGLPYRLGADPERHGATDCVGLARAVLRHQGIDSPTPTRAWYRRLRRGDTSIFWEQLTRWGVLTDRPRVGTVALCGTAHDLGLAVWWSNGWIHFGEDHRARWTPADLLSPLALYSPGR